MVLKPVLYHFGSPMGELVIPPARIGSDPLECIIFAKGDLPQIRSLVLIHRLTKVTQEFRDTPTANEMFI